MAKLRRLIFSFKNRRHCCTRRKNNVVGSFGSFWTEPTLSSPPLVIISQGNQPWRQEMLAVFLGKLSRKNVCTLSLLTCVNTTHVWYLPINRSADDEKTSSVNVIQVTYELNNYLICYFVVFVFIFKRKQKYFQDTCSNSKIQKVLLLIVFQPELQPALASPRPFVTLQSMDLTPSDISPQNNGTLFQMNCV